MTDTLRNPPADIERADSNDRAIAYDEKAEPVTVGTVKRQAFRRQHSTGDALKDAGLDEKASESLDEEFKVSEKIIETKGDPFPIDDSMPYEENTLTVRAVLVGIVLGSVVGASNIYLGLKTGFTFGPQLFGAIFGFAALKPIARLVGGIGPGWLLGDKTFGPKENVTVQTAATSAGGIGIIFVSAVPAMYTLKLLSPSPSQDTGRLIALALCTAYYGVFFVIPLRKYYVLKQKLVFPTPTATAYTIRSLHTIGGEVAARKKAKMLGWSFVGACLFKVVSTYAPGIIWDWHIGWTLSRIGFTSIIALDNYGWFIEFTPAFYGAGMLSGMNASWSFFGGAVLAWGIIAPSLIATGRAVGRESPLGYGIVSYQRLSLAVITSDTPSPRYWLLWPGVLIMLVYSFVEVGLSSRQAFFQMFTTLRGGAGSAIRNFRHRNDPNYIREEEEDNDPAPPEDRVPFWAWTGGLLLSIILTCALAATQFSLNVGEVILSLFLGFLFSFLAVQSSGDTDINPVSTVAKASQLVFGGISKGQGHTDMKGLTTNLVAGVISAGAAAQASDMTGDLKTGHLLSAKPKQQFVAQLAGATVAVFLNVGLFILFVKSAPCIIDQDIMPCQYSAPSVAAWAAVAQAVISPKFPVPASSGYTAIALAITASITVAIKHFYIPRKYWVYVPNWNAIGLAFVVPQVYYPLIMAVAATINLYWERRSPSTFEMYGFPLAAGLVAGEGIGGVIAAVLAVAGVDGGVYGTAIGCPGFQFCG